jgi:hypothetical protein
LLFYLELQMMSFSCASSVSSFSFSCRLTTPQTFNGAGGALDPSRALAFPLLSCLNKDALLSHALVVSLGASLPFAIGREPAVPEQGGAGAGAVPDSSNTATVAAAGKANDFVLNGMGIAPKHCVFKYTDEDDRDSLSVREYTLMVVFEGFNVHARRYAILGGAIYLESSSNLLSSHHVSLHLY